LAINDALPLETGRKFGTVIYFPTSFLAAFTAVAVWGSGGCACD